MKREASDVKRQEGLREQVMELVWAALGAVNPMRAVARNLQREGNQIRVGDRLYELPSDRRVAVIGAGKAGGGMAAGVEAILADRIGEGWVNVRYGYEPSRPLQRIRVHPAGHPIPDQAGVEGTRRILDLVEGLDEGDLALVLISGGASALLVQPVEGVSLEDLQQLTDELLRSGATIEEVNTVRKHLSQVKGGHLARRITQRGAQAAVLVLSDVVGNPLDGIGSGPCAPDPTTFADAWAVLERYGLLDRIPATVRAYLERGLRGEVEETPKPGDLLFEHVHHVIVGDNRTAALAAAERARALGFHAEVLTTHLEGEAREVGKVLAALAKEEARYATPLPHPACLILGGETTVTVRGDGKGGRNQEMALAAALALDGWEGVMVATLATDGTDGPTDAAGAIADGDTVARARAMGLDPVDHLNRNDAYSFFASLGDLILTGPTGTNVCDLAFVLAF
ncbi:MAG TPA: glycerate kinase [Thermoflexia bacterium]|nr:glycerate kinase [Thermoflexia bacterium]